MRKRSISIGPYVSISELRAALNKKKVQIGEAESRLDRLLYDLLDSQIYSIECAIEDRELARRLRRG